MVKQMWSNAGFWADPHEKDDRGFNTPGSILRWHLQRDVLRVAHFQSGNVQITDRGAIEWENRELLIRPALEGGK